MARDDSACYYAGGDDASAAFLPLRSPCFSRRGFVCMAKTISNRIASSKAFRPNPMKNILRWMCLLLSLQVLVVHGGAIRNLPGFTTTTYGVNDDGSYPFTSLDDGPPPACSPITVPIGFNINFYGASYGQLYLNNNGNVTFDAPLGE